MKERCGLDRIDVLHITSWDQDHCKAGELENILKDLKPRCIEYPCYKHDSDNYKESIKLINIDNLLSLINNDNVKEVVIAVKPSIEGETTALYISKLLEKKNVVVSRIAQGVPMGADIDYVDALTLELALENRKKIN